MTHIMKFSSILIMMCCVWNANAFMLQDTVNITVHTDEKTAAGIGLKVDGKHWGGRGASYTCKGPKNKTYLFGFRKDSIHGSDIHCGSLTITQDSDVTLIMKNNVCQSVLTEGRST